MGKINFFFALLILINCIYFVQAFNVGVGKFSVDDTNVCGDNIIRQNEECDLHNLSGNSCITKGYASGNLLCTNNCTFDESQCIFSFNLPSGSGNSGSLIRQCNDNLDNDNDGKI